MSNITLSSQEIDVLKLFFEKGKLKEISPKDLDQILEIGVARMIDLFLDLEVKGLIKWVYLDLMELELGRSTKEIYEEVYNSKAKLSKQGSSLTTKVFFNQKAA